VTVRSEVDVQAGATIPSQLKLENTVQPLADEDLLLWRASVGRAHGLVTLPEETPQDAQLPIAKTAPSSMLPPSAEQSMNEVLLRRSSSFGDGIDLAPRSMAVTGLEGIPVATDNSLIADELVVTAGGGDTRIATRQSAIATNPDNKIRSIHELVLRRASMDVDTTVSAQQAKSLPQSEIDTNLAQAMANIASSSVSATAPTTVPSAAPDLAATTVIAAVAVSAEGAGQGQASAGQGSLTGGSETSQILSAPDPKLTFGERVQAFADAVAQRVLGQIRNENWSVSLQLDPANLGAMEIDLTLRGNAVTANLGVANAEVRALLEAGLPRLKESLEASGLQLANWSFGQSGSRGFGESMPTPFAWQPLRGTTDDADSSADATRLATMRHNEGSRSVVDLFV
jgi:flagellar hook-length control protein FliK